MPPHGREWPLPISGMESGSEALGDLENQTPFLGGNGEPAGPDQRVHRKPGPSHRIVGKQSPDVQLRVPFSTGWWFHFIFDFHPGEMMLFD